MAVEHQPDWNNLLQLAGYNYEAVENFVLMTLKERQEFDLQFFFSSNQC